MFRNYLKCYKLYFILIIIYLILISLIYHFNILNYKVINIINYIIHLVLFFIIGYKVSSLEKKKGYLNGFLISSILIILFSIISLIFKSYNMSSLVYHLSLIVTSILGGIIGVSKST